MSVDPAGRPVSDAVVALAAAVQAALARGDAVGAESHCRALLAHDPAHPDANAYLAMRALDAGHPAEALARAQAGLAAAPDETRLHVYAGCALRALDQPARAREALAAAVSRDPTLLGARLQAGAAADAAGDPEGALAHWVPALADAERRGLLDPAVRGAAALRPLIAAAIAAVRAARARGIDAALTPLLARHGEVALARIREAADIHLGRRPMPPRPALQRPSFLYVPGLPDRPWFEREDLPFLGALEDATDAIRDELLAVLADESGLAPYVDMPETAPAASTWRALNRSPRWSAFHLWRDGSPVAAHAARCPRTMAVLEALPLMRVPGHAPEALFSILRPGTHIPPHTGVMNGRLTVHLPLAVPPDCGKMVCAREPRDWIEGRCLVFDDSYVHEAWNASAHTRAVLILDVWNPHLAEAERAGLAAVLGAIGAFNRRHGLDPGTGHA